MSQFDWDHCPQAVKTQIQHFTQTVAHLLTDNLRGIYLHGSLAMGCFNPSRSDLDLLVITRQPIKLDTQRQLAEFLLSVSCAPQPIEMSVIAQADLIPWRYPTRFDFHYSETWRERFQHDLQDGRWQHWNAPPRHDPDLAAHIMITNQRGLCLQGAPIAQVFPAVPRADYLDSILADIKAALDQILDDPVYAILNTCRVYAFVSDNLICSKQAGGAWALKRVPADVQPTLALALAMYATDQQLTAFDPGALTRFVAYMREKLAL